VAFGAYGGFFQGQGVQRQGDGGMFWGPAVENNPALITVIGGLAFWGLTKMTYASRG